MACDSCREEKLIKAMYELENRASAYLFQKGNKLILELEENQKLVAWGEAHINFCPSCGKKL